VLTTYKERKKRSTQLFNWIATGKLNIENPTTFALQDGALAHELLESRKSTGKILLIP
ncbi:zinc-binding dehydrogenase, partial [Bacillus cereus]